MQIFNYEGGESIRINSECPLCHAIHEHRVYFEQVEIYYMADPIAYEPREREIVLLCPKVGEKYKVALRVYYPFHESKVRGIEEGG